MLKNKVVKFVVSLAFILALTAGGGIAADELGWDVTSQAEAGDCNHTGGSGGNC